MAVVHQTYLFDEQEFHQFLERRIIKDDLLLHELLRKLAEETVQDTSPEIQDSLKLLRFDPEWLTDSDPSVSHLHEWYILALARRLSISRSINTRRINNHWVLSQILPTVGWHTADVTLLVSGCPLHTLVEASTNTIFIDEFSVGLDVFGGWLHVAKAHNFLHKLQEEREHLFDPSVLGRLELQHHQYFTPNSALVVEDAYLDAIEMLQPAIATGKSLFIVFD
ncbi:MAG: hypothetical protein MI924_23490 [Chloroflexales bacterium]|nr:hypothetical protein [Chloroflexales bacterium]